MFPCGMNHIHFQHYIVIHKVGQCTLIGFYASHLCRCEEHIFRSLFGKELLNCPLVTKVKFLVGTSYNVMIALSFQLKNNGTAHHAAMTSHIYLC